MLRDQRLLHVEPKRGGSRLIMRDLKCLAEVLGLYPEGPREPCKCFEELHDQLDVLERWQ